MSYEFFKDLTVVWFAISGGFVLTFLIVKTVDFNIQRNKEKHQLKILWGQYEKQVLEKHRAIKK